MSTPDPVTQIEMYRRMLRIRRFDETVKTLFDRGRIPGSIHLSIGQEAEVVGVCMALATDDCMVGNHRCPSWAWVESARWRSATVPTSSGGNA